MADEGIVSRAGMIQELFMVRDGLLCMSTDDFTHNDQGFLRISSQLHRVRIPSRAQRASYNGGLGAEPLTGSRGQSPRWEVRGASPPEAECLFVFACPKEAANFPHYSYLLKSKNHTMNE